MSEWRPWADAHSDAPVAELDIAEPPCKGCRYWAPRRWYDKGAYVGVILCHATERHPDFSCFKSRVEVGDDAVEKRRGRLADQIAAIIKGVIFERASGEARTWVSDVDRHAALTQILDAIKRDEQR